VFVGHHQEREEGKGEKKGGIMAVDSAAHFLGRAIYCQEECGWERKKKGGGAPGTSVSPFREGGKKGRRGREGSSSVPFPSVIGERGKREGGRIKISLVRPVPLKGEGEKGKERKGKGMENGCRICLHFSGRFLEGEKGRKRSDGGGIVSLSTQQRLLLNI